MPLLALVLVTAVWGVTFVQVKDAVAIYPLFAFLAVRFAIASLTLAAPAAGRVRRLGPSGWLAGCAVGALLAAGYVLQTAGLARTTVSGAGFVTGMYVILTPLIALILFRAKIGRAAWVATAVAVVGLAMISGVHAGSSTGDLLVLGGAAVFALQIVLIDRYAPRFDPLALTFVEMLAACVVLTAVALPRGDLALPHGRTVWAALLVTGIFASALGYLFQTWAQRRIDATRTALLFSLEPVWAGVFGFALAGDRLGLLGWSGCAVILIGIALAEPTAAAVLARLVGAGR
ncbi:MAG: DMT family transporter [Gaiellaceae bacterium]